MTKTTVWILDFMGDCLRQARSFMLTCEQALTDMDDTCAISKTTSLATIQSAAKTNRARAIYRSAQDALTTIDDKNGFARQISNLAHLLAQYKSGVIELESFDAGFQTDEKAKTLALENVETESHPELINIMTNEQWQRHATIALHSSLAYATEQERPTLNKLISLSAPQEEDDSQPFLAHDDAEKIRAKTTQSKSTPDKKIALDIMMPDIIHQGLRSARHSGITLSLSHDVSGFALPQIDLTALSSRIKNWVSCLIKHIALNTNKQSLVHIDITTRQKNIILSTRVVALPDRILKSALDAKRVSQDYDTQTGHLKLTLHGEDNPQKTSHKPKPIPIESGLSERLEALMPIETQAQLLAMSDTNLLSTETDVSLVAS